MASSTPHLVVAARFAGPPGSGNGGYTAGLLAPRVGGHEPVTVTLRRPPPLDIALVVEPGAGVVRLRDDGSLVAEAAHGDFARQPPPAVGLEQAASAEASYRGRGHHPFPTCFVCGTARERGDGMRLEPGRYARDVTACVWTPDPSLARAESPEVSGEYVWCALDCPAGWTSDLEARPLVLGRMTASYDRLPLVGQPYVVVGELVGTQGRKSFTASAIYDPRGNRLARAEHTWIAVDPAAFSPTTPPDRPQHPTRPTTA